MAETSKAKPRLIANKFFANHIEGKKVIDVGVGRLDTFDGADPICDWAEMHDKDICDATTMEAYEDNSFDTVYASHILEHLADPINAIKNWIRICKPNGVVFISLPHRDLYERKKTLPSKWNLDHKFFILPDTEEEPDTKSLMHLIEVGCKQHQWELVAMDIHDSCTNHDKPEEHGDGEFQIQAIIKRLA
jgi:predicted SAM-dependent methyltransferase